MPEYEFDWEKLTSGTVTVEAKDAPAALDLARDEVKRSSMDWCNSVEWFVWPVRQCSDGGARVKE